MKNFDIRGGFKYLSNKAGFPLSVLNGAGAGFAVMFAYLYTLGEDNGYAYPLAIGMGAKTFFINCVISYQVFKAEVKKENVEDKKLNYTDNKESSATDLNLESRSLIPASSSTVSNISTPLIDNVQIVLRDTTSSNLFITLSIFSVGIDIVTNFLNTYAQFVLLGNNTNVGLGDVGIKIIANTFAGVAAVRTVLFTMKFSLDLWDRIRATPPENRFKNYVGSFLCCGSKKLKAESPESRFQLKDFCG